MNYVGIHGDAGQVSLDSLAAALLGRGFIKIDVDGAELDVLRSGPECLSRTGLDLLVETHSSQLEVECTDLLKRHGFECLVVRNAWWRTILPEQRPIDHNRWLWATRS
jgi:methyltransferase FkbM-like protein